MKIPVFTIDTVPQSPLTLLNPARLLIKKHREHAAAREARDTALCQLAQALKNGDATLAHPDPYHISIIAYTQTYPIDDILAVESAVFNPKRENTAMNISTIQTKLIQAAGRWCENYASDMLYDIAQIQPFAELEIGSIPEDTPNDWIIGFGLHANGCNHNQSIIDHLKSTQSGTPYVYPERIYRKLLAVYIEDAKDTDNLVRRTIALLDMTHQVIKLDPADNTD